VHRRVGQLFVVAGEVVQHLARLSVPLNRGQIYGRL
jgi:hypothetical protein